MTLLAQALPSVSADAPYTIEHEEGEHLDIVRPDGQPILRYMYSRDTSDEQRTFDTAKIFAHVLAPGGETTLTKGPGGKFPHHRGIFIGWSKLTLLRCALPICCRSVCASRFGVRRLVCWLSSGARKGRLSAFAPVAPLVADCTLSKAERAPVALVGVCK